MRESLMMSEVTNTNLKEGQTKNQSQYEGSQVAAINRKSEVVRSAVGTGLPGSMVIAKKKMQGGVDASEVYDGFAESQSQISMDFEINPNSSRKNTGRQSKNNDSQKK